LEPSVSRLNTTVKTCEQTKRCHANVVLSASSRYLLNVHQCMHILNGLVLLCSDMDVLNGLPNLWYKTYHIFFTSHHSHFPDFIFILNGPFKSFTVNIFEETSKYWGGLLIRKHAFHCVQLILKAQNV
jgi:hypothetical protein